jgi:hypothetical protein
MLTVAGIICIICYKPLGNPTPDGSNLALGVLLFVVVIIQGVFNAWQDWVLPLASYSDSPEQFQDHGEYYRNDSG